MYIKSNKRQLKAKETKNRIYSCAGALFNEKGFNNVCVEEIAEAAGISVGGFYHHFKTKDELIFSWVGSFDNEYEDFYNNELQSPIYADANTLEKIRAMVLRILDNFTIHGYDFSRITYTYLLKDYEVGLKMVDVNRNYFKIMHRLMTEGKASGVIREDISEELLVKNITMLIRGFIVDWCINGGNENIKERIYSLLDIFLYGISKQLKE